MSSRDLNRYRKVYPNQRVRPHNFALAAEQSAYVESGFIAYTAASSGVYSFSFTFPSAPVVVVTSVDSAGNGQANVNTFITSVSTTSVTIDTSATFTGRVHFHAMYQVT